MLDEARNRMLMEVGSGTPMGELLRRYWMPEAAISEFKDKQTKPVRLMGSLIGIVHIVERIYLMVMLKNADCAATITGGFMTKMVVV